MPEITTTLARIKKHGPCREGWRELNEALGGFDNYGPDTPLSFRRIIEIRGIQDAIWCMRSVPEQVQIWGHFAIDCAERHIPLMKDQRSIEALTTARRCLLGKANIEELVQAHRAAEAAAKAAYAAAAAAADADAAYAAAAAAEAADAAYAAYAYADTAAAAAASDAAAEAAYLAADAADYAAYASDYGADAAYAAADSDADTASDAEREWQASRLIELCETGKWSPVNNP